MASNGDSKNSAVMIFEHTSNTITLDLLNLMNFTVIKSNFRYPIVCNKTQKKDYIYEIQNMNGIPCDQTLFLL